MNDSARAYSGNCSELSARTSFGAYVQELNATTGFEKSFLELCKNDICNALWGDGNSDVSGIGMLVGYFLESILGFLFALILLIRTRLRKEEPHLLFDKIWTTGREKFLDSAGYFSASVQIACMIVLVRKDFGISAIGFGGFTVQITWAVAVVSILPLVYPLFIMDLERDDRRNFRLFIFCMSWLPFCYTFISQMIGDFAPQQVGQGAGPGGITIITMDEWNALTDLCLIGVGSLSDAEQKVLNAFGAAGSIFVTAYGLLSLLWLIGERLWQENLENLQERMPLVLFKKPKAQGYVGAAIVLIPILTLPQLWGILRLRGIQKSLSDASGSIYADNQWTFGQVTATILFAPVFIEVGHMLVRISGD